ncbi:MAG TPA: protein phosphatase 2C domain-containing protein [Streptosporangiaceae bacterium]
MTGESAARAACPVCAAAVWPEDNFCEHCQAPLTEHDGAGHASRQPAGEPAIGQQASATSAAGCAYCSAGPVGADGYCEACGRKAPAPRDHWESDLAVLAAVTDKGLRHYRNEDAVAVATARTPRGPAAITVVCDGVSGAARGDEASLAAVRGALPALSDAALAGGDLVAASRLAVQAAQLAVAALSEGPAVAPATPAAPANSAAPASSAAPAAPGKPAAPDLSGSADPPSATFVSAVVAADQVITCSLGDSRAYWLDAADPAGARQLTSDDSLAAEMVAAGLLAAEDAASSPQAHVVTGWLGADNEAEPRVTTFSPPGCGAVLVCSDGLWNYLGDAAGLAELALPGALTDPLAAARRLVEFALAAGGHDNITAVLVPFPPAPHEPEQAEAGRASVAQSDAAGASTAQAGPGQAGADQPGDDPSGDATGLTVEISA